MSVLCENRKPFEDVFCLNCVLPSHISSDATRILDRPPSKKHRTTSMPPAPGRPLSLHTPETSTSRIRKLPPASPFPRVVHAPQRNFKFFGSSVRKPHVVVNQVLEKEHGCGTMGNLVSMMENSARVMKAKAEAFGFFRWLGEVGTASNTGNGPSKGGNKNLEGLSSEERKGLIDGALSDQVTNDVCLPEPTAPASRFSIVSIDAEKMIKSSMANHVEEEECLRRPPQYKGLYDSSKSRNSKLSTLDFEVRLAQAKIAALKLIPQEEEVIFLLLGRLICYLFIFACGCIYLSPYMKSTFHEILSRLTE